MRLWRSPFRHVRSAAFLSAAAAWGENPAAFHALNVLLHGTATALVVLLLAELAPLALAFVAGFLFAVHPVHVEAVANVVGLAEVLSAVLYLSACLIVTRPWDDLGMVPGAAIVVLTALDSPRFRTEYPASIGQIDSIRATLKDSKNAARLQNP